MVTVYCTWFKIWNEPFKILQYTVHKFLSYLSFTVFLYVAGRAYWREGAGDRGQGSSQIIRQRESLVLYEPRNILGQRLAVRERVQIIIFGLCMFQMMEAGTWVGMFLCMCDSFLVCTQQSNSEA